jgi:hypothetical protein
MASSLYYCIENEIVGMDSCCSEGLGPVTTGCGYVFVYVTVVDDLMVSGIVTFITAVTAVC